MAWEYLQTKELDARFLLVAGYLAGKIEGKNIVDLNCGTARLLQYLPNTFTSYLCNDLYFEPIIKNEKVSWECCTNNDFAFLLEEKKVDILCVFGHGAGHKVLNELESVNLTESALRIIKDHQPEIVVFEACRSYAEAYGVLDELVVEAQKIVSYKVAHKIVVRSLLTGEPLAERVVVILEK